MPCINFKKESNMDYKPTGVIWADDTFIFGEPFGLKTIKKNGKKALFLHGLFTNKSFKVTNMKCEGCAEKITTALTALSGVKTVKPKVIQKQVLINFYPEQIKQDELKKVLEKEGFNAVEL